MGNVATHTMGCRHWRHGERRVAGYSLKQVPKLGGGNSAALA